MLGKISILLLLFVTSVLLIAGIISVILGIFKKQNRNLFIVRGAVLGTICLIIIALIYFFTKSFSTLAL
jgi:CHASE2 domain-containing sensor protein